MSTRFDFITNPSVTGHPRPENCVLAETPGFVVVPSLGSLVPGWLLIVPKRPILNCGRLSAGERMELSGLVEEVTSRLSVFPGTVFAFEHGSARPGSLTGCGVDQAHLHLVPLNFDLLTAVKRQADVAWERHEDLVPERYSELTALPEYITIRDCASGAGLVGRPIHETSQWVRRVIAHELGRPNEWNYRVHDGQVQIAETLDRLKPLV